ncbi:hypothetical protein N5K37_23655 [Delftia tsuruhatensis]|uniref:Uncharacterized protein n=1 Tax=Delftia tsuruhatensis TaxID=180282 RepID=A0ABM6DYA6_9BURK|nr:hypothetical protein [Delftia tsuruhatensis]AOU99891.1 hypothetical protein BI380_00235 [Delftia tsuruhatensis]MDH2232908.1 hypothetical protein [Delftia tsuruhatensis]
MSQHSTTPQATGTQDWMEAMELLMGQMAFVLECEGRGFTIAKLRRWSQLCTERMEETGSVPPAVVLQLRRMADRVAP